MDDPESTRHEIEAAFAVLELPLILIDLADFTIRAASPMLFKLFGMGETDLVGRPAADLFVPSDGKAALEALTAVRDGVIDFYRGERKLGFTVPAPQPVTSWVRSVRMGEQHLALAEFSLEGAESPLAAHFGREPRVMALGTADEHWVISCVSREMEELAGHTPDELFRKSLLALITVEDVESLLAADRKVTDEFSVACSVHMRDASGAWRPLTCVLTVLTVSQDRCFILVPSEASPPEVSGRVAELEQHLRRIAAEVEASGVLEQVTRGPTLPALRELGGLTARQWEVVSRLLQGEQMPTIAAEMFISQSTVRNHLSAIFERFGVHSRAELLQALREVPSPSST